MQQVCAESALTAHLPLFFAVIILVLILVFVWLPLVVIVFFFVVTVDAGTWNREPKLVTIRIGEEALARTVGSSHDVGQGKSRIPQLGVRRVDVSRPKVNHPTLPDGRIEAYLLVGGELLQHEIGAAGLEPAPSDTPFHFVRVIDFEAEELSVEGKGAIDVRHAKAGNQLAHNRSGAE